MCDTVTSQESATYQGLSKESTLWTDYDRLKCSHIVAADPNKTLLILIASEYALLFKSIETPQLSGYWEEQTCLHTIQA